MRKLISLLAMILLLLSAALAEVSTPTCTTVTLAAGSVHGGFHHEDVRGFPGLCGRKLSGNDGWIPVPGGVILFPDENSRRKQMAQVNLEIV